MEIDKDAVSKYKCNECGEKSWTSLNKGCSECASQKITKMSQEEIEKDKKFDKKFNTGCLIFFLIVLIILVLAKVIYITTEGCTLPIDIVLFDHCLLGSFGASVGATIAGIMIFGILGFTVRAIFRLFK